MATCPLRPPTMSLQIRDTLTPAIQRAARRLADRRPLLEAMGTELVSISKRAFSDPSLRPSPWPARKGTRLETNAKTGRQKTVNAKSGQQTHSLLRKSGALYQSIRISGLTQDSVTVGSDRPYAAVHQFGSAKPAGRGGGIPARPFFPYDKQGNMTELGKLKIRRVAIAKLQRMLGQ